MSIYEYDQEEHMRMEREQHFAEGFEQGLERGRQEESAHTERERLRADAAEERADNAEERASILEAENKKLTSIIEQLKLQG